MSKHTFHSKFDYVVKIIEAGMPCLLQGAAGTGKTTIAVDAAKQLGLGFASLTMTKQTSVNAIIGFISINGDYIASQFRKAYEEGKLFLLDEIDASDPNVLLVLNTIENGYIAFPDGIVHAHPDFRLIATANPASEHSAYTGRTKLDFSTLDRYYSILIERDGNLEAQLTSDDTAAEMDVVREFLKGQGSSIQATMRDAIRVHQLKALGLDSDPIEKVVFSKEPVLINMYNDEKKEIEKKAEQARKKAAEKREAEEKERKRQEAYDAKSQHEVNTLDEVVAKAMKSSKK